MASTSKRKTSHWYGYLNAGKRSSPVLRDERLDTGNPKTLYLYNLARGQILEYAREIVDNKLRELKAAESGYIAELDAGYKKARRSFRVSTPRSLMTSQKGTIWRSRALPSTGSTTISSSTPPTPKDSGPAA